MHNQKSQNVQTEAEEIVKGDLQEIARKITEVTKLPQKTEAEAFYKAAKLAEARTALTKAIKSLK